LDVTVLRDRAPLFVRLSDGGIRNAYTIKIVNKTQSEAPLTLTLEAPAGLRLTVQDVEAAGEGRYPVSRRADGITGFVTSTALSLKALGMDLPAQRIFRYREHGMDFFYGSVLLTTRTYAERNPDTLRALVGALYRSMKWSFHNRAGAIAALQAREPLTDVAIETIRQTMAMDELVDGPNVSRLGMGVIEAPRLQRQIEAVKQAYNLGDMPSPDRFHTDRFLPPAAERVLV
jgi:NitT/TauT family transport system substrate-binding protein